MILILILTLILILIEGHIPELDAVTDPDPDIFPGSDSDPDLDPDPLQEVSLMDHTFFNIQSFLFSSI